MTEYYLVKCNRFVLSDLGSQSKNKHHKIEVILGEIIIMFAVICQCRMSGDVIFANLQPG